MRIATVVGARPQFVKAAPVSRALKVAHEEWIVHTGQHYDDNMSGAFFRELGLPEPYANLGVGSGDHGAQTGAMLTAIETTLLDRRPDLVLVYGDTNSTLAGALAAAKLHIPVAHVEAGLRSFNRQMPEEINRVVADHLSDLLFAPSANSAALLAAEGIKKGVHVVGDVMLDVVRETAMKTEPAEAIAGRGIVGSYAVATLHRAETTDNTLRLQRAFESLLALDLPVLMPVHPRTASKFRELGLGDLGRLHLLPPVSHREMVNLVAGAAVVITDSGGLQKEAYFLATPCVTLRTETEWVETVETGWNTLCHPDTGILSEAVTRVLSSVSRPRPTLYGDGNAARRILEQISLMA